MARAKRHNLLTSLEAEAEAVLRRGGGVSAEELLRLIHAVNPTGGGLRPEVEARRYALKSRLQSLLVCEFKEDVAVEALRGREGVVGLRYRPKNRDACHAVIAELDDEARSWVQLVLDQGG